jgi:hypothetical protein
MRNVLKIVNKASHPHLKFSTANAAKPACFSRISGKDPELRSTSQWLNGAFAEKCEPLTFIFAFLPARVADCQWRKVVFSPFLLSANDFKKDPTMTFRHCVAVDLGASSGRVMLATWDCDQHTLSLREMHRFANCLQKQDGF